MSINNANANKFMKDHQQNKYDYRKLMKIEKTALKIILFFNRVALTTRMLMIISS